MAKRVTMSLDKTLAAIESGERLRFVPDDGRGCCGCFFTRRCESSGEHVFTPGSPACMAYCRADGRDGHWEQTY